MPLASPLVPVPVDPRRASARVPLDARCVPLLCSVGAPVADCWAGVAAPDCGDELNVFDFLLT